MEDITLKVSNYKIANAKVILACSLCNGAINVAEKYINLKLEIGGFYRFKPIFLHYEIEGCKKTVEELRTTKNENKAIKKLALFERKIQFAKACSREEIITNRQKTKELFDLGYELLATSKGKESIFKEAKIYQESGKITSIAFFDEWYEIWVKKV